MAGRLIDDDAELAHKHALSAGRRAGRIAVVRESVAITAYAIGDFALALRELRTYRRLSGSNDQIALMVDSERGVGRPERALELGRSVERSELSVPVQVSLAIAMSGARLDLGQAEQALEELEIPQLDPRRAFSWSPDLFDAYAIVLEELGRSQEAEEWYQRSAYASEALEEAADDGTVEIVEEEIEWPSDDDESDAVEAAGPADDDVANQTDSDDVVPTTGADVVDGEPVSGEAVAEIDSRSAVQGIDADTATPVEEEVESTPTAKRSRGKAAVATEEETSADAEAKPAAAARTRKTKAADAADAETVTPKPRTRAKAAAVSDEAADPAAEPKPAAKTRARATATADEATEAEPVAAKPRARAKKASSVEGTVEAKPASKPRSRAKKASAVEETAESAPASKPARAKAAPKATAAEADEPTTPAAKPRTRATTTTRAKAAAKAGATAEATPVKKSTRKRASARADDATGETA
ncbi:hypothetical protein [Schumannella soli]|uniref:Tetratricopeptide repeat protein n=1 Tax=Schumannella soli TaxID=2590779 RepID=A0A506XYU4_9MICO|nr:hypothetical protein [Schumannella soli]TPW74892.1 hypothetical protein FJ657_15100 [Schumannella soli]